MQSNDNFLTGQPWLSFCEITIFYYQTTSWFFPVGQDDRPMAAERRRLSESQVLRNHASQPNRPVLDCFLFLGNLPGVGVRGFFLSIKNISKLCLPILQSVSKNSEVSEILLADSTQCPL